MKTNILHSEEIKLKNLCLHLTTVIFLFPVRAPWIAALPCRVENKAASFLSRSFFEALQQLITQTIFALRKY